MNKALICVDVEQDFLPGGALAVPDGHEVIPVLIEMMDDVDVIVLSRDWHPQDHISFADGEPLYIDGEWPVHCVQGTPGADIDDRLFDAAIDSGKPVLLVHKGMDRDVEQYSAFDGIVVDVWNEPLNYDRNDFLWNDLRDKPVTLTYALFMLSVSINQIGGLALDYCVKATALDSVECGFLTSVYLNATRPVGFLTGAKAVLDLTKNNVKLRGF